MAKKDVEVEVENAEGADVVEETTKKKYYYITKTKIWDSVAPLLEKYPNLDADFVADLTDVLKPKERSAKKEEVSSITERLAAGEITAQEATELLMGAKKAK